VENNTLTTRLKEKARELGFALCGIAPATDADGFPRFEAWLDRGLHGEMQYLSRLREARRHPRGVLDEVRSVLMVGTGVRRRRLFDLPPLRGRSPRRSGRGGWG
jgi:epoxyqueuosine reductase